MEGKIDPFFWQTSEGSNSSSLLVPAKVGELCGHNLKAAKKHEASMGCGSSSPHARRRYRDPADFDEEIVSEKELELR